MKKIYIASLILAATQVSKAQVTFNASNYPNLGSAVVYNVDTIGSAFSIQGGTNQNWDFSGLATHGITGTEYVSPASTPFASNFPTATVAVKNGENYFFNRVDSDGVFEIGQAIGAPFNTSTVFSAAARTFRFPLAYTNSYDSQFNYRLTFDPNQAGIDSVRIGSGVTYNFIVDSWGTVTIPSGQYPCIRKIQTISSQDTIFFLTAVTGWQVLDISESSNILIYYLNPQAGAPVVIASRNPEVEGEPETFTVQHYASGTVNVNEPLSQELIQTFPNPANEIVNIKTDEQRPLQILVFDNAGRLVDTQHTATSNHVLNTASYPAGFYTLRIQDNGGRVIGTSKISIAK